MKLKLKHTTRTPYSDEIAIFDFDNLDAEEQPVQIGKLDAHYVDDQIVGTLLISQEFADGYRHMHGGGNGGQAALDALISEVLAEVSEPVGVSGTYAIEVYYPSFESQGFFDNYSGVTDESGEEAMGEYEAMPKDESYSHIPPPPVSPLDSTLPPREDDDFSRRLRER